MPESFGYVLDELLNVTDIKASFVLYNSNGTVNVSARSFGEINVQLIMESLGGGGHQKASGATLKNRDEAMSLLNDLNKLTEGNI